MVGRRRMAWREAQNPIGPDVFGYFSLAGPAVDWAAMIEQQTQVEESRCESLPRP
jgi:hypothetical protein